MMSPAVNNLKEKDSHPKNMQEKEEPARKKPQTEEEEEEEVKIPILFNNFEGFADNNSAKSSNEDPQPPQRQFEAAPEQARLPSIIS